jgi:hypothetical protein
VWHVASHGWSDAPPCTAQARLSLVSKYNLTFEALVSLAFLLAGSQVQSNTFQLSGAVYLVSSHSGDFYVSRVLMERTHD